MTELSDRSRGPQAGATHHEVGSGYKRIQRKLKKLRLFWGAAAYGLGGAAAVLSAISAADWPASLGGAATSKAVALVAAGLMALVTGWAPVQKFKNYDALSWRLRIAREKYQMGRDPAGDGIESALLELEKILGPR